MKYLLLLLTIFSLQASAQEIGHALTGYSKTPRTDTITLSPGLSASQSFLPGDTVFIAGTPYGIILGIDSLTNRITSMRLYYDSSQLAGLGGKTPFHGYTWDPDYLLAFTYSRYFGYVKLTQSSKWEKCIALFMDVSCPLSMGFDHKGFRVPDQIEVGGTVLTSGQFYKYRGAGWKKGSVVGPLDPSMH